MAATDSTPVTLTRADLKRLVRSVEALWDDHTYAHGQPPHTADMDAVRAAKRALGVRTESPPASAAALTHCCHERGWHH